MSREISKDVSIREQFCQVRNNNRRMIQSLTTSLRKKNMAIRSMETYIPLLYRFSIWNAEINGDILLQDLGKDDLLSFFEYGEKELKWSSSRVHVAKVALKQLGTHLKEKYKQEKLLNAIKCLEPFYFKKALPSLIVSRQRLEQGIDILCENHYEQWACLLALLTYSSCKKDEVFSLKTTDFEIDQIREGFYEIKNVQAFKRGNQIQSIKRHVYRIRFDKYFDLWLNKRQQLNIVDPSLFGELRNEVWYPLTPSSLNDWIDQIEGITGINLYGYLRIV